MTGLENTRFYKLAQELWEDFLLDAEILKRDELGKVLFSQLARSLDSIPANIEEGFGRGYGKEYPQFLRIARGSAMESRGRYKRLIRVLSVKVVSTRLQKLDSIIAMITKTITTLEQKHKEGIKTSLS